MLEPNNCRQPTGNRLRLLGAEIVVFPQLLLVPNYSSNATALTTSAKAKLCSLLVGRVHIRLLGAGYGVVVSVVNIFSISQSAMPSSPLAK